MSIVTMDTWGKPLVFGLPGHQKVLFLIYCGIGMVCGALSLTILIRYPASASLHVVWFGVVLLSLNVMAYWLGFLSLGSTKGACLGFIPWILILCYGRNGPIAVERFMLDPLGVVLLTTGSWSVTGWVVKTLLQRQTLREACQMDILRHHAWPVEHEKYRGLRLADAVNQWFCRQMRRHSGGVGCYVWAAWYKTVGRIILGWKGYLLVGVLLMVWMGYTRSIADPLLFIMMCFIPSIVGIAMLGAETLVTAEGRVPRFWAAVMGGLAMQVCTAVSLAGIVLLSYGLARLLPEATIQGQSYIFHALPWRILVYPIGLIPALLGLILLLRRHFAWLAIMCAAVAVLMIIPLMQDLFPTDPKGLTSGLNVAAGLLSYVVLMACSYWHCFRQDIV
ncbi:MAG: hypothetical protein K9N55_07755 [Phycisphaerae bacterium]|nr:hypothetical protein [Phycisphaerae bacterium]